MFILPNQTASLARKLHRVELSRNYVIAYNHERGFPFDCRGSWIFRHGGLRDLFCGNRHVIQFPIISLALVCKRGQRDESGRRAASSFHRRRGARFRLHRHRRLVHVRLCATFSIVIHFFKRTRFFGFGFDFACSRSRVDARADICFRLPFDIHRGDGNHHRLPHGSHAAARPSANCGNAKRTVSRPALSSN